MTIGFVTRGSLDEQTGGNLYDRMLRRALEERGHRTLHLAVPAGTAAQLPAGTGHSVGPSGDVGSPLADLWLIDELCHGDFPRRPRWLEPELPVLGIVHHLRADELASSLRRRAVIRAEQRFLQWLDGVVCNSNFTQSRVTELAPGLPTRVATPGGDRLWTDRDTPEARGGESGQPLRIASLGNLLPHKNVHALVDAFCLLPKAALELRIAGREDLDPAYANRVRRLVEREDSGRISMLGSVDDDGVRELLAWADVLVGASTVEGFGIVYLEAMLAGVVPVAGSRGGAVEIIRDDEDGLLVKPGSAAGIAAALQRLQGEEGLLARLSNSAMQRAGAFPGWEETFAVTCAWLEQRGFRAERA